MKPGTRRWIGALLAAGVVLAGCSSTNQKKGDSAAVEADDPVPELLDEEAAGQAGAATDAAPAGEAATDAPAGTPSGTTGGSGSGAARSGSGARAPSAAGAAAPDGPGAGSERPLPNQAPGSPEGRAEAGPAASPGTPAPGPAPAPGKLLGPETGQGFTASSISIGMQLIDETSSRGAGLIGASSTDLGDTRKYATTVVDHINRNGGVAGRKVEPVFHTINIVAGTWDSNAQASCSAFAEDSKVFAAVSAVLQLSEVLTHCLAQHKTPVVVNGRGVRDDKDIAGLGDFVYMPSRLSATRWGALTVDGLAEAGYFEPGAKVGILRFDTAVLGRMVNDIIKPRLAKAKVNLVAEEAVSFPDSVNGFGATSAQISSAVLRMRSAGVTHLLPIDDHGIMCFLLLPQAESQGFRPRYGFSTNNQPFVMEENSPPEQMQKAVGVGWVPADDMALERTPPNPLEAVCQQIFKEAGAEFPSRYAYSNALNYCDSLLFLQAALARAPSLSVTGLRAGTAALGTSYASPYTFATDYGRKRIDGASAYRTFRFQSDCNCFRYEGADKAI